MRVLIVKISSMGDIIHTLPAITDASHKFPNILFDWVIEETFSEIPAWHPYIHQIIPIKLRFWKQKWYKVKSWKEYCQYIKLLNNYKYDLIIDAQGLLKTSLFVTNNIISGTKHGMDFSSSKEPISCLFYHKRHYINKQQHAIERIRQLFSYSLQYPLPLNTGQYNIKHHFTDQNNFTYFNPYLIFFHSTTQPKKQWPEPYWSFLLKKAMKLGLQVKIPFWTKPEESLAKRLQKYSNQIIILPKLTLNEIAVQIIKSIATISVDTGLSHLSAALNQPNLTLYGPTDPTLIGTYGNNQIILQSSTKKMKDLHPDYVWNIFYKNFQIFLLQKK